MMDKFPMVSCIMPTHNRRKFVQQAIKYYLRQDYKPKEIVISDDSTSAIGDLVPTDDCIRYIRLDKKITVGAKRNLTCEEARGEIIVHWDDDDWHAPNRLSYQVGTLLKENTDICGLDRVLFFEPSSDRAWEYVYTGDKSPWVYGATLCYKKAFWRRNPFPDINVGEDNRFVWSDRSARILELDNQNFFVGLLHNGNTSPKYTGNRSWTTYPVENIRNILLDDMPFYQQQPMEK